MCVHVHACLPPVHLPGIGQYDLLAGSGGRRALGLLHGHQVADIGQHSLQVRHFAAVQSMCRCELLFAEYSRPMCELANQLAFVRACVCCERMRV